MNAFVFCAKGAKPQCSSMSPGTSMIDTSFPMLAYFVCYIAERRSIASADYFGENFIRITLSNHRTSSMRTLEEPLQMMGWSPVSSMRMVSRMMGWSPVSSMRMVLRMMGWSPVSSMRTVGWLSRMMGWRPWPETSWTQMAIGERPRLNCHSLKQDKEGENLCARGSPRSECARTRTRWAGNLRRHSAAQDKKQREKKPKYRTEQNLKIKTHGVAGS